LAPATDTVCPSASPVVGAADKEAARGGPGGPAKVSRTVASGSLCAPSFAKTAKTQGVAAQSTVAALGYTEVGPSGFITRLIGFRA
jgi:hypothetical protein